MDLCPQSVITSPSPSPQRLAEPTTCGTSPGSSLQLPDTDFVDLPTNGQSCFSRPLSASCLVAERLSADPPLATTGAMAGPGWGYTEAVSAALAPTTSSTSVHGLLAADYDPLVAYEASLSSVPYSYSGSYPSGCTTLRASAHGAPRSTAAAASRALSGSLARQMKQGDDGQDRQAATSSFGTASYPLAGNIQAPNYPSLSSLVIFSRSNETASPTSVWRVQDGGSHAPAGSSQPRLSSEVYFIASSAGPAKTRRVPRKHTTKEEANFQCSVQGCGKFFSRSYNFKSHMETHDDQREYPFPCLVSGCCKRFVRKTDLQRHHQSVHKKERNHGCDYCGRLFARKDTLRRHMEDGCSKRFDIETLDLRSEDHDALGPANRGTRPSPNRTSAAKILPPIAASLTQLRGAGRYADMEPNMQIPGRTWEK